MEKKIDTVYTLRPNEDMPEYRAVKHTDLVCPFCGSTFEVKFIEAPIDYFSSNSMFGNVMGRPMRLQRDEHEKVTLMCSKCHIELSNIKIVLYTLFDESKDAENSDEKQLDRTIELNPVKSIGARTDENPEDIEIE